MTPERLFNSFIPPPKKSVIPPKQISGYAPVVCIYWYCVFVSARRVSQLQYRPSMSDTSQMLATIVQ